MRIFISHSENDIELARTLKKILEKNSNIGEAFIFEDKKKFGSQIEEKITSELNNSNYFIAIITESSISSASVHQELGYAQAKNIEKIPMRLENTSKGFLLHGAETLEFTRKNFEDKCLEIQQYIVENPRNEKFTKEEELLVQKSAHFRYEIKQQLDEILDAVIVRFDVCLEKRDWIRTDARKRKILFDEIFKTFDHPFPYFRQKNHEIPQIEKRMLEMPFYPFRKFNREFEYFRDDVKEIKDFPHEDLFPDEQDAYQKFNRAISNIEKERFELERETKKWYDEEDALHGCNNFLQIMEKYPKDASVPLRNVFRSMMGDLSLLVRTVILLEFEIDKIYEKFGDISLKESFMI